MAFFEFLGWLIFYLAFAIFVSTARTASPAYRAVLIDRSIADWTVDASLAYRPPDKISGSKVSPYFRAGWRGPDGDRRWGDAARSTIMVEPDIGLPFGTRLQGRIATFPGNRQITQTVTIEINGIEAGSVEFDRPGTKTFDIELPSAFDANERIAVTFDVSDVSSPFLLHVGNDPRPLGVCFYEMSFLPPN